MGTRVEVPHVRWPLRWSRRVARDQVTNQGAPSEGVATNLWGVLSFNSQVVRTVYTSNLIFTFSDPKIKG